MSVLTTTEATELQVVERSDRSLAAAMHIGSIFAPILVPAAVYVVKSRSSKFVGAHARSAIMDAIVFNVILGLALTISFVYSVTRLWALYQNDWEGFDWKPFVIRFVIGWIILGVLSFINMVMSLRQAFRAYHGHWPKGKARS